MANQTELTIHLASVHKQNVTLGLFDHNEQEEEKEVRRMDSHSKNLMFKDQRKAHFPALVSEQEQRPKKKEEIPFEKKKKKKTK